eukprot:scaffold118919_cov35-Tisochrysis_lutea.AAC.4
MAYAWRRLPRSYEEGGGSRIALSHISPGACVHRNALHALSFGGAEEDVQNAHTICNIHAFKSKAPTELLLDT